MKKFLIGACALAVLSACQRSAEPGGQPQDSGAPAPVAAAAADPADSAKRLASYKMSLVALVAGSYGGECIGAAGAAPKEGVSIDSAGVASAQGWKRDLMGATDLFMLSRTVQGVSPVSASLQASGAEGWNLALDGGPAPTAIFGDGPAATRCQNVQQLAALRAKKLYPAIAPFFMAGNTKLLCVDALASRELPIEAGPAGAKVGERTFSFERGLKGELAAIDSNAATLNYKIDYEDGSKLSMSVDGSGMISELIAVGQGDANYTCTAVPRNP